MGAPVLNQARDFFVGDEIPEELGWIALLAPGHLRLFRQELYDAVQAQRSEQDILELLSGWEATAELDAAPEVLAEVRRPKSRRPLKKFLSA